MRTWRHLLACASLSIGCGPDYVDCWCWYSVDLWPLSQGPWTFESSDPRLPWLLELEDAGGESTDEGWVVNLEHRLIVEDEVTVRWRSQWSNGNPKGLRIHGYEDPKTRSREVFVPPVDVAHYAVHDWDEITTWTGGDSWTAEAFMSHCDRVEDDVVGYCQAFTLDDSDDPSSHPGLTGTWVFDLHHGPVLLELDAFPGTWHTTSTP